LQAVCEARPTGTNDQCYLISAQDHTGRRRGLTRQRRDGGRAGKGGEAISWQLNSFSVGW